MQLSLMLQIVVCDVWPALWIFFEFFFSKIFGITLQDLNKSDNFEEKFRNK